MEISEQEFARMVKAHKSTIYTVCYMFSNDEDEVADLFQEVMIKVWRGLPSFNGQSDVKTWIYRIALNTCISIDKKKKRHKETKLVDGHQPLQRQRQRDRTSQHLAQTYQSAPASR